MQQRLITIVLATALALSALVLVSGMSAWRLPDREQGYSPEQPIAYSHRLHAGTLKIDCQFCHWAADQGRHAGIPASDVCMKCHTHVKASFAQVTEARKKAEEAKTKPEPVVSIQLQTLYDSLALDDQMQPIPGQSLKSIEWQRVHNLPDFASFDHRAHVVAGVVCQDCHGPVESMERMRQVEDLSMGWCVNCHRDANENGIRGKTVHASTGCAACHH